MPDFYSQIETDDKTENFQSALLELCDKMLNEAGISDGTKLQKIAQLRAYIAIHLKDF